MHKPPSVDQSTTRGVLVVALGMGILYALAVIGGRSTHLDDAGLAMAWPAAGVGIVWCVLARNAASMTLAILGIVVISGVINQADGLELLGAWLFGLVNASNGVVAALLLRRRCPTGWPRPITTAADAWSLLAAASAGAVVSALAGAVVASTRFDGPFWDGMVLIAYRNALSGFVVVAALFAVPHLLTARRRSVPSTVLVAVATLLATWLLMEAPWPITYALIPPIVLIALRWGPELTAVMVALQGVVVVVATTNDLGPFSPIDGVDTRVLVAQGLVMVLALVGFVVAATEHERARALAVSRDDRDRLQNHMEAALVAGAHLVASPGQPPRTVEVNGAMLALTGAGRAELTGTDPTTWLTRADAAVLGTGLRLLLAGRATTGWRAQLQLADTHGGGWVDAALSLVEHEGGGMDASGVDRREAELHLQMVDITAQKRAELKLAHAAVHDDLTGLANRTLWADSVERALAEGRVTGDLVAVLYVDVDRFKRINDTYGHDVGDAVMRAVADRLRTLAGELDTVARLGGDEFAVLCPAVGTTTGAIDLAEQVQQEMGEPIRVGDRVIDAAVSIGIAFAAGGGEDDCDGRLLLRRADTALYAAKDRGRARYQVYGPDLLRDVDHAERVLRQLEVGHRAGELVLHYQPIVHAMTGELEALEALVRWQHPQDGLLSPAEFLEVLESSDLIHQVGIDLLHRACADIASLPGLGPDVSVHVNVSARELIRAGFVPGVRDALRSSGLAPHRLVLEITEHRLITVDRTLLRDLVQLREMGVEVAVDDFGTGYSALTHLVDLPISIVKLDRSFVSEIVDSRSAHSVCSGVRAMAEGLGIRSVAEGVETAEQAAILRELGYDQLQGFHFARPAPLSRLGLTTAV